MMSMENVAVFWDYENCPAPASTSGYAIANSISALARSYGSVKVFKAYLEISDQSRPTLRSELQSSGVSLVDCPHNGRKDVADKMILVDMLSYAIDSPAPSTIFLITGDRDFAYALSILRNRHYRVVLVKRPDTHVTLTFQACISFDWFDDVVHQAENPSIQAEQSPKRLPYRHRQSDILRNATVSTPSVQSATEDPTNSGADTEETADIVHFLRDKIPGRVPPALQDPPQVSTPTDESPRQDREISSSPRHRRGPSFSTSRNSTSNSVEKPQQTSHNTPPKQLEPPCTALPEPRHTSPFQSHPADIGDAISPFSSPILWPTPGPPMTPNSTLARRIVYKEPRKSVSTPTAPPMSVEELSGKFLKKPANDISPSSTTLAISSPSPPSKSSSSGTTVGAVKPAINNSMSLTPRNANPTSISNEFWMTASGSGRSTGPFDTPIVPPDFVILVEALQWQRSQGILQPYRNIIAERISKKGTTYQRAGVSSFREYSLLAEQADIVDMGGIGGRDWIRLKPKWHSTHVLAPTTIC